MRYVLPATILIALILSACSPQRSIDETSQMADARDRRVSLPEEAVIEAVFRYQIHHYPLSSFPSAHFRCVSAPGANDPAPALLARLGVSDEIRKISDCKFESQVTDARTGQRGIVFKVERILELHESEALVEGGYYYDPLGVRDEVYHLTKEAAGWVVQHAELKSIS